MDRFDLLIALKEAEGNANRHFVEVVEQEKAKGNPIDHLYDPRKDEPVKPRVMTRYDGHNKYRRHGKWTGYNQTTGEQKSKK